MKTNWLEHKPVTLKYKGKYVDNWFSNMVPSPMTIDGRRYNSVENYFQAMKTLDDEERDEIAGVTPSKSKWLGRRVTLRKDWEEVKYDVMKKAVKVKFSKERWKNILLATGDEVIVEWNNWGDRIWGATLDGIGKNLLGKILMEVRDELNEKE